MARSPATFATFWIMYLHQEASLATWFRLIREFWRGHTMKSLWATTFIALSMLFVIAFPTLAGAMTGYTPAIQAFVRRDDSSFVLFSELELTAYVIHDGARINRTNGHVVPLTSSDKASEGRMLSQRNATDPLEALEITRCPAVRSSCLRDAISKCELCSLEIRLAAVVRQFGTNT